MVETLCRNVVIKCTYGTKECTVPLLKRTLNYPPSAGDRRRIIGQITLDVLRHILGADQTAEISQFARSWLG